MNLFKESFTRRVLVLSLVAGMLAGVLHDTFADDLGVSIDGLLTRFNRQDAPGLAVGVVKKGTILYAKGWGMADLEQEVPLTPDSVFDIASVSKQFAGLAIAMLEDEGKLQLTDPIRDHVSGLPEVFAPVQLHHLLHHTSGIRDWPGAFVLGGRRFDDVITFEDILALARRQESLSFAPGEMYSYSNTGYNLLARIVETVSGESFSDWMDTHVFQPLNMDHSHFYSDHDALIKNRVRSYSGSFDGPFKNVGDQLTAVGSSSLYSSVNDLLKWMIHFDRPSLISAQVVEKMVTPGILNNGDSAGYAYGFGVGQVKGAVRISHSGGWAGFRTFLLYYPEFNVGVVVLSNWGGANVSEVSHQIADRVIGEDWASIPPATDDDPVFSMGGEVQSETLASWVGEYLINNNPSSQIYLFERNGRPWIRLPDGYGVALDAVSDDVFSNDSEGVQVSASRGVNGWPRSLSVKSSVWSGTAKDAAKPSFEAGEAESYEGDYYSRELLARYLIQFEDGELIVHHHRHDPVRLSRFGKDRFTSGTWFWGQVDFDRDFQGDVTSLRVTQGRNRNMLFRKVR